MGFDCISSPLYPFQQSLYVILRKIIPALDKHYGSTTLSSDTTLLYIEELLL